MKKVLFMIPNLGHGGAEKVLINLVNHMDLEKFQITIMALYDEGVNKQFLSSDIEYKACFKKSFTGVGHFLKLFTPQFLYKYLVRDEYDIVISYLEGQTARIISGCNAPNTRKVCWIHRTMTELKDASRMFRSAKESEECYNSFDFIVSVSKDVQDSFMNVFHLNNKGIVLYNTNQSELILNKASIDVNNTIFKPDEMKICAMGSLIAVKGFDRLIRVHKRLRDNGINVHTYILGEGTDRETLEKQIEQSNLRDSVSLLGYQENPYKYLKRCDVFVCSSYSEGFSTAATEALICGIPVVTTRVSGMNELLGDNNEYGCIAENNEDSLYNELQDILLDNNKLKHYQVKAVERGKHFDTKTTVNAVMDFLMKM